ncbi:MAG: diaminopimelate decarboxylase [Candidatus Auribacter fodinae]|jgi:diaminopimelate decarboxylase|uniref:Diaminopimelate decarboxylase n=1 Tax=Candidatus Auribacter fodinae TaxID=2093366 RepID=A0A3A4R771_9BACT|nr:MAG: diaminopimelate decarboxylase [Candidatus Auribacter fodinae]
MTYFADNFTHSNSFHQIKPLLDEFGSPLYVYDEQKITDNFHALNNAFADRYEKFKLCYAIKANANPAILRLLRKLGAHFDCSSMGEIYLARNADAQFIIYSGNYNSEQELRYAVDNQSDVINLDNITLLNRLASISVPDTISFRINPGLDIPGAQYTLSGRNSKFGIHPDSVIGAYRNALELGVKKFGIHLMTGSNVLDTSYFSIITEFIMRVVTEIKQKLNIDMEFVDIGGGFGIPYAPDDKELDISYIAENVTGIVNRYVNKHNLTPPTLIIEPGRYITGNAGYLIGTVQDIKQSYRKFIGTDISMNAILRIPLFNAYHKISILQHTPSDRTETVTICGQVCCENDVIRRDITVPCCSAGDIIVIHDIGAYGFAHSTRFNMRLRPAEVLMSKGIPYMIRERETLRECDRLTKIPEHLK